MLKISLQSIVLILLLQLSIVKTKDLLRLFRPKPDLPQELNDFLTDVQEHKKDFAFIRNVARNQRKHEQRLRENHRLFKEDSQENLITENPFDDKNHFDNLQSKQHFSNDILGYDKPTYSDEKYSKFIHSPVRLPRNMEDNYLDQHVQLHSNAVNGNIKRSGQKYPNNMVHTEQKNKYHTGYIVGMNEDDGYIDKNTGLKEKREVKKKKREVEINIKTDGKLVKHVEEDQNGPKSIVLTIKSDNDNSKLESPEATTECPDINITPSLEQSNHILKNENPDLGPSNSKTIPSLTAIKKVGVPLSSVLEQQDINNRKKIHEMSNYQDLKLKLKLNKHNEFRPKLNSEDIEQPETNNPNFDQGIDIAQSNMNSFENIEEKPLFLFGPDLDMDKQHNKNQFETVQSLVLENTVVTTDGSQIPIETQSGIKKKRNYYDNVYDGEEAQPNSNAKSTEVDYSEPLNQPLSVLDMPVVLNQENSLPEFVDQESTIDPAIVSIITTESILDVQVPILSLSSEQFSQTKSSEEIGKAVVDEIEKAEEIAEKSREDGRNEGIENINEEQCLECHNEKSTKKKHHREHKHKQTHNGKKREVKMHHQKAKEIKNAAGNKKDNLKDEHSDKDALRDRKHLPALPKYKRKWLRQHQKKRVGRETDYYDLNKYYDSPDNAFDFIPSYNKRKLKSADYEFDPHLIPDIGNHQKDFKNLVEHPKAGKIKIILPRKKYKSESDYEDEEVPITSSPSKKVPSKKTRNRFGVDPGITTEDNDDDYDYADLSSDAEDEDDDIGYEEEEIKGADNLDIEEAIGHNNKNEHEDDRLNFNNQKRLLPDVINSEHTTIAKKVRIYSDNLDKVLMEAKDDLTANAHAHGGGRQKKKKKGERKKKSKNQKGKKTLGNKRRKRKLSTREGNNEAKLEPKPLTNQQKQDIFLRNNPEFQRWPRFVQNDNQYHKLMRERALNNQQRLKGKNQLNNQYSPNEYFVVPRAEFKREETSVSTVVTTTTESEATSSTPEEINLKTDEASTMLETTLEGAGNTALIQAAQDIIQSANPDLFDNTERASTNYYFTTISDDLTLNTQCDQYHKDDEITPCPEESATHCPATITSVLPLIPESKTQSFNVSKDEFLDLNDIVAGTLPRHIASHSLSMARGNIRQGLKRSQLNMNLVIPHFNSSAATGEILNEMNSLMLKLKYHTVCQALPANLYMYVKLITKNEMDDPMGKLKEMDDIDFDEHQSTYMFHSGQNEKIQDNEQTLKELLNKYNNLPQECKERAEPVREYIVSHLAMIEHMTGKKGELTPRGEVTEFPGSGGNSSETKPKVKKAIHSSNFEDASDLDTQMMEEGLKNRNAGANKIIEDLSKVGIKKREVEESITHISTSTSQQYGKLANAVRNVRNIRQVLKRINQIYGKPKPGDDNKQVKLLAENEENGFESPQVINL
ncbi:unnamed protein product [Ceutorhynchus assimilis]|uniref:Uncharacterized protein n=1 Tax=Ceutorhynchus assimilis TaxID=467358 RepID=A0A9N9MPB6_9CUCU|nr:unnamed protein product [Ceutorhynchus assimilis]